jgi:hypothetical protein
MGARDDEDDTRRRPKASGTYAVGAHPERRLEGPATLDQWSAMFIDDAACRHYLAALRWPRGFLCPHCRESAQPEWSRRGLIRCGGCDTVCSPATRTLLDGGPWSLRDQFRALFDVARTEQTLDLHAVGTALGGGPMQLAPWLRQLRRIYRQAWRRPLHGMVELDRVTVEVNAVRKRGRCYVLALAVQTRGQDTGRIRVQRLPEVDGIQMTAFVEHAVGAGTCLRTRAWSGYGRLRRLGYGHLIARERDQGGLGNVEQLASILRVWAWSRDVTNIDTFLTAGGDDTVENIFRSIGINTNRVETFVDSLATQADEIKRLERLTS